MRKVKVAIVGSRSFTPILGNISKQHSRTRSLINAAMKNLYEDQPVLSKIISGGADGADKYGEAYAAWEGVETEILKPDWETHGNSAGYLRNAIIVEKADIVVAYWDGESKGTKHTIELAIKQRKPLIIIRVDERG